MTQIANFKGIYAFKTNNDAQFSTHPSIAGTYLGYYWAQIEAKRGQYDWSQIDRDMAPWIAAGKKVILRISSCGWAKWQPQQNSGHAVPAWVYALGVRSVKEDDGAIKPEYWNAHYQSALGEFIAAFAKRYDGNSHVAAIEIAVGDGGETKPDTRNNPNRLKMWQSIGYTDQVWWDAVRAIVTMYRINFKTSTLVLMPDNTFIGGTKGFDEHLVVNFAISQGLGLQNNGLIKGQLPDPKWKAASMIISEQRNATTATGDSLTVDLQTGLDYAQGRPCLILVFHDDIINPKNQAALTQYAAMVAV